MQAFSNSTYTKAQTVALARDHRHMDMLRQAHGYWDRGKGCSVGCFTHGAGHDKYPAMFGLPVWLARVQDVIFEGLSENDATWWHVALFDAVQDGADIEPAFPKIIHWILTHGIPLDDLRVKYPDAVSHIDTSIGLYQRWIAGDRPSDDEFSAAADLANRANRADLANLAYRANRANRANLADLADLADLANRANRANRANLADLADLANRADLAYRADRQAWFKRLADAVIAILAETPPAIKLEPRKEVLAAR